MTDLTPAQASLARTAQLLQAAAEALDAVDDPARTWQDWAWEADLHAVAWQVVLLLPEGTPIGRPESAPADAVAALRAAEQELRRHPIWDYPPGTPALVAGLCDLITGHPDPNPLS